MSLIRRQWTPDAADHWTREDAVAAALSAASYLLIIVGGTLTLIASVIGYITLAAGLGLAGLMYWVIDPKLRAISAEYERKQQAFIERMEEITRWEAKE